MENGAPAPLPSKDGGHDTEAGGADITIASLTAAYLRATAEERNELIVKYPLVLTGDVTAALDAAAAQLSSVRMEAREAVQAVDSVDGELDLPQEAALALLSPEDRLQLEDPEAILRAFTNSLAALIADATVEKRDEQSIGSQCPAAGDNIGAEKEAELALLPWHQTSEVTLMIFSYLSVEELLMTAENVCRAWRFWLYQPDISKYFWIEAVQREYPEELGALIQAQGSDVMHSDWRTIAMFMCVEAGSDDDGDEVGSEQA